MKFASVGLAACLGLATVSGVSAAAAYGSTEECVAALGALDIDGDGYVEKAEQTDSVRVEAGADSDGDGRLSNVEQTVACRTGAVTATKGGKQK